MKKNFQITLFLSIILFLKENSWAHDPSMYYKFGYFLSGFFFYIPVFSFVLSIILIFLMKIFIKKKHSQILSYMFLFGLILGYLGVLICYNFDNILKDDFIYNAPLIATWITLIFIGNILGYFFKIKIIKPYKNN